MSGPPIRRPPACLPSEHVGVPIHPPDPHCRPPPSTPACPLPPALLSARAPAAESAHAPHKLRASSAHVPHMTACREGGQHGAGASPFLRASAWAFAREPRITTFFVNTRSAGGGSCANRPHMRSLLDIRTCSAHDPHMLRAGVQRCEWGRERPALGSWAVRTCVHGGACACPVVTRAVATVRTRPAHGRGPLEGLRLRLAGRVAPRLRARACSLTCPSPLPRSSCRDATAPAARRPHSINTR
eukprot:4723637-Pleurochrysis_carterae.AAC.1